MFDAGNAKQTDVVVICQLCPSHLLPQRWLLSISAGASFVRFSVSVGTIPASCARHKEALSYLPDQPFPASFPTNSKEINGEVTNGDGQMATASAGPNTIHPASVVGSFDRCRCRDEGHHQLLLEPLATGDSEQATLDRGGRSRAWVIWSRRRRTADMEAARVDDSKQATPDGGGTPRAWAIWSSDAGLVRGTQPGGGFVM